MSETKTVWHPVKAVLYDRAKHADLFDLFETASMASESRV